MHAFVREIARRNQSRPLSQVIHEVFPFDCNYELAHASRFHSEKRKTVDRSWERAKKPSFRLKLPGPDPEMDEAREYAEAVRPVSRSRHLVFSGLPTDPMSASRAGVCDARTAFGDSTLVLVTQVDVLTAAQLGVFMPVSTLQADTAARASKGFIGDAVRQQYGPGLVMAYHMNAAKSRLIPGSAGNAEIRGYWRLYVEGGLPSVAVVTYCSVETGDIVAAGDLQVAPGLKMAWHFFLVAGEAESMRKRNIRFTRPAVQMTSSTRLG